MKSRLVQRHRLLNSVAETKEMWRKNILSILVEELR